ncbi:laminin subunit alpha-5 isoform X1 [Paramormyrops kingsleyae]|uniref:laminin subunit alpha-5 isoform X1 n=2 Tax=Paramormyrops kingsleyae TaxID=1676925 RepID=UPI003B97273B
MARGVPHGPSALVFLLSSILCPWGSAQELPGSGVNGFSLHPPYFNLAEGTKITATATCGEDESRRWTEDLYCKLVGGPVSGDPSQTIQGQYCDICTAGNVDKAHPITNAIDGTERWWQSPPLSRGLEYNAVNVTLDLGQLFHVAYVLVKFANSPRPDLWVLERSVDFGENYQPWQYFASSKRDCIERFGQRTIQRINKDNDVICTTEYSRIVPLENGEIVVSLVNGRPGAMNFSYSPVLRDFTKATNIRLRFLRTNTLLGHLMGKALRDPTVTRRYYYSIKDISIGGRCVCNGHADACNAKDPNNPYRLQCDCQHNTCGPSCDQCCPGFNQMPWRPATTDSANECEPCNCNGHAYDCHFDAEVDRQRASINLQGEPRGGGVCRDCQHHTMGINCDRCISGYYRSPEHPLDSPWACAPCDCQSDFTDGTCEDLTGRCYCKPNYTGENCDSCAEGYLDFPQCLPTPPYPNNGKDEVLPASHIIHCDCNPAGTEDHTCRADPHTGACVCKEGFASPRCDHCAPGFHGPSCQICQCQGPGCLDGACDPVTGQAVCHPGYQGFACDQCAPDYFSYPLCQLCSCSAVGSLSGGCDQFGRCRCRPGFQGPRCDECLSAFLSYPYCQVCSCDPRTSLDSDCGPSGHCRCRPNFAGPSCDQCAPGYYGYPSCIPCQCSHEGSRFSSCDQLTGQCSCLSSVVGQRCDSCSPGSYGFPLCQAATCNPAGSLQIEASPAGSCECRVYVEGPACDQCKPLYWKLSPDTPYGCSSCECNIDGIISSVAECVQSTGQCYCKPGVCGGTCAVCKDGYFNLRSDSFFGCQGCQCDIGGSAGLSCGERNGRCRCRPNVEGPKCNQPRPDHYFPDLHHLKFELEDGSMLDGRPVRFGYDPLEFPGFSWRGYAQMSPIQSKVMVNVLVVSPDLFHVVLRYVNHGVSGVWGTVSVLEDRRNFVCGNCSAQSKQILFSPSTEPTFINVPQNSFVEPFVLNPGMWTVVIEAEGILLDFLVLLPSAYYEAPILQVTVTEPCTYAPLADASQNCLLYTYLSLDGFPHVSGAELSCRSGNHLPRLCHTERITAQHPPMAVCRGSDVTVQLRTPVPQPGDYAIVVEYASEGEAPQGLTVSVTVVGGGTQLEYLTLLHCNYSFLCRVVAVDDKHRVAFFSLSASAEVQLLASRATFFLHKVHLIPRESFTMEFLEPSVFCISSHGSFSPGREACVPSRFQTPSRSLVLKEGQPSSVPEQVLAQPPEALPPAADSAHFVSSEGPPTAADETEHVRLDSSQNAVTYSTRVLTLGRYVVILHHHQPLYATFTLQVFLNGGRVWQGHANATFCPHAYGCRSIMVAENQIILDVTDNDVFLTVQVPIGKTLWLDYVLLVPEESYSSNYLDEEPLDKSYDFISSCGQNSFYINPTTSSRFCRTSAASLSAFFNNGAVPCSCHEAGASSDTCQPFGGQCRCRPHVIGRDCSQCATGYWGFPNCRPCECGAQLCEPMSGECICPPRTLRPDCVRCEPQTFGCHPLIGCEVCNCSQHGVAALDTNCDADSGQCRCKNHIVGRQCDRCVPGFYGFPHCRRCDCHEEGTEHDVCDPHTGRCLCKENVEGPRCAQCRVGTFLLNPANPRGCTSCFCFGATDRCRSSDKRRAELKDMSGWSLHSGDRQEVPVYTDLKQDLVEADLRDVPDVYQDLHWQGPRSYLGDKVSSYGGHLRYQLDSQTQHVRGDGLDLPAETFRPDVILKGSQMTVVYMEKEYPDPGSPHKGAVHLVEGSFRHAQTGNAVSREELMMVLSGLEALHIRALHAQSSLAVSLRHAVLEGANHSSSGEPASSVEMCLCPASYQGDSCQRCAPGYYRDGKGLFLGKCVPCNCNGHSDHCLDGSGICTDCQHSTAGDHCEKCRAGFLGNSTLDGHAHSCTSCPCPLQVTSNNFAEGCVNRLGHMQCLCMRGYSGPNCERCAPGFYGNPMVIGSTCQPCQCHGNTDPNMLFSDCDPLAGVCRGCMHSTAGAHCETCAPGFHGDAIDSKNCTRCSCSPCGTASCDPHTGQCHCKPGVTGAQCDRCEAGSFGFDSCNGCRRCDCDAAAALSLPCDQSSGACACQPGVNGPQCQQCAPGYWAYGPDGCRECKCRTGLCDPRTGECHCSPGLMGRQCDLCVEHNSVPVLTAANSLHCQRCDSCVITLLHDLERLNDLFQLGDLNVSSTAWKQLHNLNISIAAVAEDLEKFNQTLDDNRNRMDLLEAEARVIVSDTDDLEKKANLTRKKATDLKHNVNETHQRAEDLLRHIQSIVKEIKDLIAQANSTSMNKTVESVEDLSEKLTQVQDMLREMSLKDFQHQKFLADTELAEAKKLIDRVKKEIVNLFSRNEDLVKSIRNKLAKFHNELKDLRNALNEAENNTAHATEINNINEKRLEDILQRVRDLQSQKKMVDDLLQMAEDAVTQVNDLLSMLQESKEDYERLAAKLDGARKPLAEKVQKFAPAAAKIPLVEDAEQHAKLLDELANNLTSITAATNRDAFIQRLVNASRAYTNIVSAILEAEAAANAALLASKEALETVQGEDLAMLASALKNQSNRLVEEAKKLQDRLNKDLKPQLQTANSQLRDMIRKKDSLSKDLEMVRKNLNFSREDTSRDIADAKQAAEKANATANRVKDELHPIQQQLDEWKTQYGDTNMTNKDLDAAFQEANKSVGMLADTIPLLLKKLDGLQNHSTQAPNISENIMRIRELIEQARRAASRVNVAVKFNGTSAVQVRNPENLADLAAFTSLKFYITLPEAKRRRRQTEVKKQFVLYLGGNSSSTDFLAVVLEGTKLRWMYRLGGQTADDLVQEDIKSDGSFNTVVLQRTLQYGQIAIGLGEPDQDQVKKTTMGKLEVKGDHGLLNLPPEDTVFYVGGFPDTFKPPPELPKAGFEGCIELETLNEQIVSLYNFKQTFQLDTTAVRPCGRVKPVLNEPWVNDGAYFDGTGYAEIPLPSSETNQKRFEQEVRVLSHSGILLLLQDQTKFLCLAIIQRRLKLFYDLGAGMEEETPMANRLPEDFVISDGKNYVVEIILLGNADSRARLLLRKNRTPLFQNNNLNGSIPNFSGVYYMGGVPADKLPQSLKSLYPDKTSIRACFRNIKAISAHIDLKRVNTSGVSYGCPNDLLIARQAYFSGVGYLELQPQEVSPLQDGYYAGFGFRTDQTHGLMFYHQANNNTCQVYLDNGHVVVESGNSAARTLKTYNDESNHYIAFYSSSQGLRVLMDDVLEKTVDFSAAGAGSMETREDGLYLGGAPQMSNITGCISNLFIKRMSEFQMVVDLVTAKRNVDILFTCPAAKRPWKIMAPTRSMKVKGKKAHGRSRSRSTRESCQAELASHQEGALQFSSSSQSYQRFDTLPDSFRKMPHFSLGVRANSSEGLILHAAGEGGRAGMALSLSSGHFVLLVNGGRRKASVRSRRKYDDGQWHTVFVRRDGEMVSLVVDGINSQTRRVSFGGKSRLVPPLYIGGLPVGPPSSAQAAPGSAGFAGCVRDVKLKEEPLGAPSRSVGVVPCFQGAQQPGLYISSQGGHVSVDNTLLVGGDLEIQLEMRVVGDTGVVLHAGGGGDRQLTLYLNRGEVTVTVNNGNGSFSASLSPAQSLCDGQWHSMAVVKKGSWVQLDVDTSSRRTAGPAQGVRVRGESMLYLGGVPDGVEVPGLPSPLPSLHGCFQGLILNRQRVNLAKPLSVHGGVGTQGCPVV